MPASGRSALSEGRLRVAPGSYREWVAVRVGFLVLFGVVDHDGVVMNTYLKDVFEGSPMSTETTIIQR